MKATLENRIAKVEAAFGPAPSHERGRSFIIDGNSAIDQATGKEPNPETLGKIKAGERSGPFDVVIRIVRPGEPAPRSKIGAKRV
jgi:hypothetical protein